LVFGEDAKAASATRLPPRKGAHSLRCIAGISFGEKRDFLYHLKAMRRIWTTLAIGLLLSGIGGFHSLPAKAGDEDEKQEQKAKPERAAPVDKEAPDEPEGTDMSVGGAPEEKSPVFSDAPVAESAAPKKKGIERTLDDNIDYETITSLVETGDVPRGVLAPAPGFRGYRPNMIALGYGDRTPGWGGMLEYSGNRVGFGVFASGRKAHAANLTGGAEVFGGLYGLYRMLPWGISPYFDLGVEAGYNTDEQLGGMAGAGVEVRVYEGWTALLGWTYHSTVRRGFLGGALGWSF
jgi:hypothetical protein